eukprot:scaffold612515_cov34-Prasinocladus_malaysianus.AAC.1
MPDFPSMLLLCGQKSFISELLESHSGRLLGSVSSSFISLRASIASYTELQFTAGIAMGSF